MSGWFQEKIDIYDVYEHNIKEVPENKFGAFSDSQIVDISAKQLKDIKDGKSRDSEQLSK